MSRRDDSSSTGAESTPFTLANDYVCIWNPQTGELDDMRPYWTVSSPSGQDNTSTQAVASSGGSGNDFAVPNPDEFINFDAQGSGNVSAWSAPPGSAEASCYPVSYSNNYSGSNFDRSAAYTNQSNTFHEEPQQQSAPMPQEGRSYSQVQSSGGTDSLNPGTISTAGQGNFIQPSTRGPMAPAYGQYQPSSGAVPTRNMAGTSISYAPGPGGAFQPLTNNASSSLSLDGSSHVGSSAGSQVQAYSANPLQTVPSYEGQGVTVNSRRGDTSLAACITTAKRAPHWPAEDRWLSDLMVARVNESRANNPKNNRRWAMITEEMSFNYPGFAYNIEEVKWEYIRREAEAGRIARVPGQDR